MRETSATRFYELMVITSPEGTPEELTATVDHISGYITGAGGVIIRTNFDSPWGRRRLSYPIRHESHDVRDGFYTLIHLQLEPGAVATVERDLKLNDRLMRYLVLQLPGEPVFPEPEVEGAEGAGEAASGPGETDAASAGATATEVLEPPAGPEVAIEEPQVVTEEAQAAVAESEVTAEEPGVATEEPEVATQEPALAIEEPEAAAEEADADTAEPEVAESTAKARRAPKQVASKDVSAPAEEEDEIVTDGSSGDSSDDANEKKE